MNAEEIKKIRKDLGLNQTEFGEMLGVGLRSVQNWENGSRNMSESAEILLKERIKYEHSTDNSVNINTSHQSGNNIVGSRESELLEIIKKKDEQIAEKDKQIQTLLEILKTK